MTSRRGAALGWTGISDLGCNPSQYNILRDHELHPGRRPRSPLKERPMRQVRVSTSEAPAPCTPPASAHLGKAGRLHDRGGFPGSGHRKSSAIMKSLTGDVTEASLSPRGGSAWC